MDGLPTLRVKVSGLMKEPMKTRMGKLLLRIDRAAGHILHRGTMGLVSRFCDEEFEIDTKHGFRIHASPSEHLTHDLVSAGTINTYLTNFVLTQLRPGQAAWDVGAEKGWFSLAMAAAVGPRGRVLAFEPFPRNYQRLVRNLQLNGFTWATPVEAAVSDKKGRRHLLPPEHTVSNCRFPNTGIGHLLDDSQANSHSIAVEVTTLDDQLAGVDGCLPSLLLCLKIA